MSTNQTTTVDMDDEQLQTEMFDVQLIAEPDSDEHAACVDGLWLTEDEVHEMYTEVIEQETPRRDSYALDDLSSIDFYHNYDGTYTLGSHNDATTLEPVEWEAICEWFMQEFEDSQETSPSASQSGKYVNDLHEYLEEYDDNVGWKSSWNNEYMKVFVNISNGMSFNVEGWDVRLRHVQKSYESTGDTIVFIEGPAVDEIIEAEGE